MKRKERYFVDLDADGVSCLIPVSHRAEWQAYMACYLAHGTDCDHPECARVLEAPELLTFADPVLEHEGCL